MAAVRHKAACRKSAPAPKTSTCCLSSWKRKGLSVSSSESREAKSACQQLPRSGSASPCGSITLGGNDWSLSRMTALDAAEFKGWLEQKAASPQQPQDLL